MKKFLLPIFVLTFMIYFLTSAGKTPHDYFTRLSSAFLQGRYYLTEKPSWLTELIPVRPNKYYVVYPPMPAIVLMPFTFLFGENFPQEYLAHILGAGVVILTIKLSFLIKKDKILAIWSGLLAGLGTIIWFLSATGSSWYLGQITAAFFLTAALVEALDKKRAMIIGLLLGAAYLSRIHTLVSLPLFLYLVKGKSWIKTCFKLSLGIAPFILFNFSYNFVRFGVIWDKGYFLLPLILNELNTPWFAKGVTNLAYIPNNLKTAFWSFPKLLSHPPYIQPSWAGLAIWITTPAFIFSFFAPTKERVVKFSWLATLAIFLIVASHGGTGWTQFGYRFAVDFYPFLIFLTIKGVARAGLKWYHWLLLSFSILVNAWGVIWINKFGWISF